MWLPASEVTTEFYKLCLGTEAHTRTIAIHKAHGFLQIGLERLRKLYGVITKDNSSINPEIVVRVLEVEGSLSYLGGRGPGYLQTPRLG